MENRTAAEQKRKEALKGRADIAHYFTRQQAKMKREGLIPNWENFERRPEWEFVKNNLAPEVRESYRRLWTMVLAACPDRRDQRGLGFLLCYLIFMDVGLTGTKLKPRPEAFGLNFEEAKAIEELAKLHHDN